jgi:2,5-dihydroxypyridine 5,6-dioxygenase
MAALDPRIIGMLSYATIPFALNVRPGESVLIVVDTETDALCWQALAAAGSAHGAAVTVALSRPVEAHGHEPPAAVAAAMFASDHVMLCTTRALAHSAAAKRCQLEGRTIFFMEEITPAMLSRGATLRDYEEMQELGRRVMEAWTRASTVHVSTDEGTDFRASVEGREGLFIAGKAFKSESLGMCSCAFPDGEAVIAPVEGSGNGVVVFDTTAHAVGRLREPMRLTVVDGVVVEIEGGPEAETWRRILEEQDDPESWKFPAEIAIGLNPKAQVTGSLREDKKLLGSCHMAVGTNADFGGTVKAKVHMDGLMRYPTVRLDDALAVEGGRLLL